MGSIIKVDHLSYVYNPGMPNAVTALDDVSFEVEEGDFVGIIGATGSGKSTLITHMNGLNKPTSGHIIIDGRDLWAEPEKDPGIPFPHRSGVPVPGVPAV